MYNKDFITKIKQLAYTLTCSNLNSIIFGFERGRKKLTWKYCTQIYTYNCKVLSITACIFFESNCKITIREVYKRKQKLRGWYHYMLKKTLCNSWKGKKYFTSK
jgi:hypothetical protein